MVMLQDKSTKSTKSTNDKIQIHIVSSVKGGCGKTAFSLFKALEVALELRDKNLENRRSEVLWIDADFKGTASRTLFYGKDEKEFTTIHGKSTIEKLMNDFPSLFAERPLATWNSLCYDGEYVPYTINDYLCEEIQGLDKMIVHGYVYGEQKTEGGPAGATVTGQGCINGMVDFIFSSGRMADKRVFNYGSGLPTIEIGRFTYLMRAMMQRICEKGKTATKAAEEKNDGVSDYKHIVIDMPPGDDAYSSALMRTIREFAQERKDEIEIHLYVLTTGDRGHMDAMLKSVWDTCEKLRKYKYKEKIHIVLSEIRTGEFDSMDTCKDQIKQYQSEINREFVNDNIKIDVSLCKYQEEYYKFCRVIDQERFAYEIQEVNA